MYRASAPRLLLAFVRTAAARFVNRFLYGFRKAAEARRRRKNLTAPAREATTHRGQRFRAGSVLGVVFSLYLLLAIGMAMALSVDRAIDRVKAAREFSGDVIALESMDELKDAVKEAKPGEGPFTARVMRSSGADSSDSDVREELQRKLNAHFAAHGMAGFRKAERAAEWRDVFAWMSPATRDTAWRCAALFMMVLGIGTLLLGVGLLMRHVAKPEPSLAWLFEFPVPRWLLFTAKIGESLFDSAALLMLSILPCALLLYRGWEWWQALGWGVAFGFAIALSVAAVRVAVEVVLLQKFSRRARGTITGLCAAFGALLLVVCLYGGGSPQITAFMMMLADQLPDWFYRNPLTAGFGLTMGGPEEGGLVLGWLRVLAISLVFCVLSVRLCSRITRGGLEPGLETMRGRLPSGPAKPARFTGLAGKELLMLMRQRSVMVQVLLAPAIMLAVFYMQTGGRLLEQAAGSPGGLVALVYGMCAYMVLIAAQSAMQAELKTLWLLLSLPRPLAGALRIKSRIWAMVAGALAMVLMLWGFVARPDMAGGLLLRLPFLLIFLYCIAELTVGIRALGSSVVSETTVHCRRWAIWLPLILSAAAGQALHSGDFWNMLVQAVLLAALNVSVWQKLTVELPWLTEPAEDPPPRLYLMHGLLAAYAFFALQSIIFAVAMSARAHPVVAIAIAYAVAAVFSASLTALTLRRRKVRVLPEDPLPWRSRLVPTAAGLLVAGGAGAAWLWALQTMSGAGSLSQLADLLQTLDPERTSERVALILTIVVAAPLCEEYIFRGLVYQGLRRTTNVFWSVVWSSLFFTAVHPAVSAPAVCTLAAVNALLMERTRSLWPCILVHAGYNAGVLWLQA